ncbi:3-oxoadipate enol-lactonase [Streptomyces morookaense]|uniref:bifunctional 3-oxoadipate enol-lactonase/4-carboxymuconolactone decarboxylase PcaDC n=1 Tax=Streptomyces morookaense TaxID=1970 RepID=UPI00340527C2
MNRRRLLHHRVDGPHDAPVLVLGPSLGTSLAVWAPQLPGLARRHRTVRWDLPGHGGSPASLLGPDATVDDLAGLVLDLADSLGAERFAYAGISLGGAIGSYLAARHPERVTSLALICSAARFGTPPAWRERGRLVREKGIAALAASAPDRWFTPAFRQTAAAEALIQDHRSVDPGGYAACCHALAAVDLRDALPRITAPTLIVAGRADRAVPPDRTRELADGIADSTLVVLPRAAHLATVEQPQAVLAALHHHFAGAPEHPGAGEAMRRAVLGDDHVDRAAAATTAFTAPFQDFITHYAWGGIWTRPGLDLRTRSCITLTALVAGGRHEELALHVRAALRNGLTPEEISEVLLQTAVYCGVPAANAAFAVARRVVEG